MTRQQVESMQMLTNYVLVRILRDERAVKFSGGDELYIDPTFEVQDHAPRDGIVVSTPSRLIYDHKNLTHSMEWKTEMQLRPGDHVWFEYLAAVNALGRRINIVLPEHQVEELYYWVEDTLYLMIPYSECIVAKRDNEIIPLNGYTLIETHEQPKVKSTLLDIPVTEVDRWTGIVRYVGRPNDEYLDGKNSDTGEVKVGDRVLLRKFAARYLEHELYKRFDGNMYWIVQQRHLDAVITPEAEITIKSKGKR